MFEQQPMKMAAAEALCETTDGAPFSILAIGDLGTTTTATSVTHLIEIPGPDSLPGHRRLRRAPLQGVDDLQRQYEETVRVHRRERRPDQLHPEPRRHLLVASAS